MKALEAKGHTREGVEEREGERLNPAAIRSILLRAGGQRTLCIKGGREG